MEHKTKYRFEQLAENEKTYKLYVYDDVTAYGNFNWKTLEYDESETSANYFRKQLEEIPEDGLIELHINSNGGSVKEGVAIYNLLKQHKAEKVCYVDGFAYSIASVICMACEKIVMGTGTSMLVHNMSMGVYGDSKTLRKCADDLDVLMESNRKIYMERAKNLTEEQLIEMMDAETFLTPEQCLQYGFCDEIEEKKEDQEQLEQRAQAQSEQMKEEIGQLQKQLKEITAFREELTQLGEKKPGVPEEKGGKAIKMMSAFLTAMERRKEN